MLSQHEQIAIAIAEAHDQEWAMLPPKRQQALLLAAHEALVALAKPTPLSEQSPEKARVLFERLESYAMVRWTPLQRFVKKAPKRAAPEPVGEEEEALAQEEAKTRAAFEAAGIDPDEADREAEAEIHLRQEQATSTFVDFMWNLLGQVRTLYNDLAVSRGEIEELTAKNAQLLELARGQQRYIDKHCYPD